MDLPLLERRPPVDWRRGEPVGSLSFVFFFYPVRFVVWYPKRSRVPKKKTGSNVVILIQGFFLVFCGVMVGGYMAMFF